MRPALLSIVAGVASAAPCDIFAAAGTPCVGAFSLLRSLFSAYDGPLYVVRRASDNTTRAIPVVAPGGLANVTVQESFCAGTDCVVWRIVDQSQYNNDLTTACHVALLLRDCHGRLENSLYGDLFLLPGGGGRTRKLARTDARWLGQLYKVVCVVTKKLHTEAEFSRRQVFRDHHSHLEEAVSSK